MLHIAKAHLKKSNLLGMLSLKTDFGPEKLGKIYSYMDISISCKIKYSSNISIK